MTSYVLLPFAATSPWRLGVADVATFATTGVLGEGAVWANFDQWSHPITQAAATDPLATVRDLVHGGTFTTRIPPTARIAAGSDAHMHIVAPDRKTVTEHFGVTRTGPTTYICQRRAVVKLSASGLDDGCRAYGGSAIGGLIRGWEVKAGRIDHPLAIALRQDQMRPGPVWPATEQDTNAGGYTGTVPMGSYLAIPRSIDLGSLGIRTKAATLVARACQEFGAYVVDSSGATSFYLEDDADPVTAAFHAELTGPDWTAADLRRIFGALRVVTNNTAATPNGGSAAERRLH